MKFKDYIIQTINIEEETFPQALLKLPDCPRTLYALGNLELLKSNSISIVGTRACSEYAYKFATDISNKLSNLGIVIVSGMADGIDEAAHYGAIKNAGTIAVIAGGFNQTLKGTKLVRAEIILQNNGLIISEYMPDMPCYKPMFLERNRIIAALSLATLVVEAPLSSGAMNTAKHARKLNKPLFVVPWNTNYTKGEGCNLLLVEGAMPVTNFTHIINKLNMFDEQLCIEELNQSNNNVPCQYLKYFNFIKENSPIIENKIVDFFKEDFVGDIISALTMLELDGFISLSENGYYIP